MKPFVRRWAEWPRREASEGQVASAPRDSREISDTRVQRADKTDRSRFGGFVSSLTGRPGAETSRAQEARRCARCCRREDVGIAVLGCAECDVRRTRSPTRRQLAGWLLRTRRRAGGPREGFRLIDGGDGDV